MTTIKLSEGQRKVMEAAGSRGFVGHSGRGGWSRSVMEALERKGLVTKGKTFTHEINWTLTDLGRQVADEAFEEFLDGTRGGKS